jgi:hypothetical protein
MSQIKTYGYVPDGLSEDDWDDIRKKERRKKELKFQGTSGMKFRSRSFEEFAQGRENGTLKYNFPMENAKDKLEKGIIKPEDVPYMQRNGGMPDDSDIKVNWVAKLFRRGKGYAKYNKN